jgi:hypothetical protein
MKSNDENEKEQNSLRAQNLFQRKPSSGVLRAPPHSSLITTFSPFATMTGGHSNKDKERHDKHATEEERLLRKAREYVEKHKDDEHKKRSRHDHHKSDRKRDTIRHHDEKEKSRKKHRKHRRHYSSEEDSSRRSNRDDKKKRKKDFKKRSKQDDKKSRHEKKKTVNKANLVPLGDIRGSPPIQLLDAEKDYFAFHQHLFVFLNREEGAAFNDLSSDEAHKAFKRFVKRYNAGDLEVAYYDGLPSEAIDECKTTNHTWKFSTSETERRSLQYLQEGVRKQTEYEGAKDEPIVSQRDVLSSSETNVARLPTIETRRLTPEERLAERTANRRLREHVRTTEEELLGGRKDGRERQIEKKKERAAAIHGAARDREDAQMGGIELNDDAIYGSGDGAFKDALARERQRNAQREQKKQDRVAELKKKEQEKQEAMIKALGLTGVIPGQKIKIAPRNDN